MVRVRFAPSPTGYLHVGGARTALFNWLFARRHGGRFVLRVEDTDLERSSEPMVRAILDGMAWLGLTPDEGPHFQSAFRGRHVEDARRLLREGRAYRCFCPPERIREEREAAERAGGAYAYPRTCRELSEDVGRAREASGEPCAVRFRVEEGRIAWDDLVHGPTAFDGSTVDDFVILRSDGSPTYNLSVVSDDLAMEITHVIRGDDHISNTPKQLLLYRAMGRPAPEFAHLPLILGEDRKRLSKRHGAMSVLEYREGGYLPGAMVNFLALLGWAPGDDRQVLSRDALIAAFDLAGVGRSGAVFDLPKLEWLNGQWIGALPLEEFAALVRPHLEAAGLWDPAWDGERRPWLLRVLTLLQPRARTLLDPVQQGRFFWERGHDFAYDPEAARKHLRGDGLGEALARLRDRLADAPSWTAAELETILRGTAEEIGLSGGKLIHPVRLAVTGQGASPGLFEVLELLGREATLARLERLLGHLAGASSDR